MKFPGPIARRLWKENERYYARNTAFSKISVARRDGPFVIDEDGNRHLDFHCDAGVNNLGAFSGAKKQIILQWMETQNGFSSHHDAPNRSAVELARRLCETSPVPQPSIAFFSNSGAEANTAALKAIQAHHWARKEYRKDLGVSAENAFHGRMLKLVAHTCSKPEVQRDPFLTDDDKQNVLRIPYPKKGWTGHEWYGKIEKMFSWHGGAISFALLELPCQGEGGVIEIDEQALAYLYLQTKIRNIFFWVDEIQCGMGRTGTLFGCDKYEWLKPDILTLGKALGGGLPFGATIMRSDLNYPAQGMHSSTFGGHQLICSLAQVALDEALYLIADGTIRRLEAYFSERLAAMQKKYPHLIQEVRGLGAMWALEFPTAEFQKEIIDAGAQACNRYEFGLRLLGCGRKSIRFMPPLNIPIYVLEKGMNIFEKVMARASKKSALA